MEQQKADSSYSENYNEINELDGELEDIGQQDQKSNSRSNSKLSDFETKPKN